MPSGRFVLGTELLGLKSGKLTVIGFAEIRTIGKFRTKKAFWKCRCECGNETVASTDRLRAQRVIFCGCAKHQPSIFWTGYEEISGSYWTKIQRAAASRNITFNLKIDEAWTIFLDQRRKCRFTGQELCFARKYSVKGKIQTASLDRKDSSQGYFVGNVQWIHKEIQPMKDSLPDEKFINICRLIANHCL